MTEAEAAAVVRKIVARPTNQAFDCAAGAIVRLFGHIHALEKRVRQLERDRADLAPHLAAKPRRIGRPRGSKNLQPRPPLDDVDRAVKELTSYRGRV